MKELGPFRLLEPLGKGGMGEVWRAVHQTSGAEVAVKVLKTQRSRSSHHGLFQKEIEAVARLDHPAIAMILEHGRVPPGSDALPAGNPWFAMEHCRGGSLDNRRGRLGWWQIRRYLLILLDGLAHAHARGIVHRDLKPSNLLLGGERSPLVLVDFGLAHVLEGPSPSRALSAGTPAFMAPEQFASDWRAFGPWTDLYAVGCVAWALMFGRSPFDRKERGPTAAAHLEDPLPDFPTGNIPDAAHAWVSRLVQKLPEDRFSCAADAARALARIEGGTPRGAPARMPLDSPPSLPSDLAPTVLTNEVLEARPTRRPVTHGGSPVPDDWRQAEPVLPPIGLVAAGIGLLGLRRVGLVGRQAERDVLWSALREAQQTGDHRVVWLTGSAGIGRSRLALWLAERADELGVAQPLVVQHASPSGPADGLGATLTRHLRVVDLERPQLVEALRSWLESDDPWESLVLAEALVPAPDGDDVVRLEGPSERERVLLRAVLKLASRRTLVVVVDDIQWGEATLATVSAALRGDPWPIVWVVTERSEAERSPRVDAVGIWADPRTRHLELGPLVGADAVALARAMLPFDAADASRVARRTGGHPQLTAQMVGSWVERGLVRAGPLGFTLARDLPTPGSLAAAWDTRLDSVLGGWPAAQREALQLAALLGSEIDVAEWRRLCASASPPADPDCLAAALHAGLLRTLQTGRIRFAWVALRERLEARIPAVQRARWHHLCAAIVQGPDADERRAHHLLWSGATDRALELFITEGEQRLARDDYDQAAALLDSAREAAGLLDLPMEDPHRARIDLAAVKLDVVRRHGRADAGPLAVVLSHEGLSAELRGEATQLLGLVHLMRGQIEPTETLLRRATELLTERSPLGETYGRLADLATWTGRYDQAEELLDRAEQAYAPEHGKGIASVLTSRARLAHRRGHTAEADKMLLRAREHYTRMGSRRGLAECANELGEIARAMADLDRAALWYREARDLYLSLGTDTGLVLTQANLAVVDYEAERFESAAEGLEAALARARRTSGPGLQAGLAASLAAALLKLGQAVPAAQRLGECLDLIDKHTILHKDVAEGLWWAAEAGAEHFSELAGEAARAARAQWVGLMDDEAVARVDASGLLEPQTGQPSSGP